MRAAPPIRVASRFSLNDQAFATRYRSVTHAIHVHDYSGRVRLGAAEYPLNPGVLTFTPAGVESRYSLPAPGVHWCIHFEPAVVVGPCLKLPVWIDLGRRHAHVAARMEEIVRRFSRAGRPGAVGQLTGAGASLALQELLLWLAESTWRVPSRPPRTRRAEKAVDDAASLLRQRLDRPLDVPALAAEVGLSQNYLARHFRQRFGQTLPRFFLMCRMNEARRLLETTDLSVKAAAARVGMPDAQHFNKQYRRFVGMSPTATRAGGQLS